MGLSTSPPPTSEPNELRTDFLGRQVVLTPKRADRPHDFIPVLPEKKMAPADCYFCPGNENKCPPEIDRIDGPVSDGSSPGTNHSGATHYNPSRRPKPLDKGVFISSHSASFESSVHNPSPSSIRDWACRVFSNKFPAFSKSSSSAYGVHEVLVETPHHALTLSQLSDLQLQNYLTLMVRRLRAHARDKKIKATIVFKNEWADAGASLEHTHTQLVGMPTVPASLKKEEKLCKSACPFCLLAIDDHYSKIISSGHFLLLAPFAPRFNHETWIVPKSHTANLTDLDEKALAELAHVLGVALRTQDATLGYPPYNLLFHLSPHSQKNFHFRIEICPRLAKWAGFEHAAEVVMNSVKPEWTASEYKSKLQA